MILPDRQEEASPYSPIDHLTDDERGWTDRRWRSVGDSIGLDPSWDGAECREEIKHRRRSREGSPLAHASPPPAPAVEIASTQKTAPDPAGWTRRLYQALHGRGRLTAKANLAAWKSEFAKLAEHVGADRVEATLRWYCRPANMTAKYTPGACSAASFRKKFIAIEDAMRRVTGAPVRATGDTARTAEGLGAEADFAAVRGSVSVGDLPTLIEASLPVVAALMHQLTAFAESGHRLGWLAGDVAYALASPRQTVVKWLTDLDHVARSVGDAWKPAAPLTSTSPWLARRCRVLAVEVGAQSETWDDLCDALVGQPAPVIAGRRNST